MGYLDKIFGSSFKDNKYDIDRKEYKALKAELKEKYGIKLTRQQKADFKDAVKNGKLGEYLDSSDMRLQSAMGLSLSNKIGKTDATKDAKETQRLEKTAYTDTDLLNTLRVTNPDIYQKVVAYNATPIAQTTQKGVLSEIDRLSKLDEFSEAERNMENEMAISSFMQNLDRIFTVE